MKKTTAGASTLKFFAQAAFGFVKDQIRWVIATGALAVFASSVAPKLFHEKTPSSQVDIASTTDAPDSGEGQSAGFRAPSSIEKPVAEKNSHSSSAEGDGHPYSSQDLGRSPSSSTSPNYSGPNGSAPQARNYQNYASDSSSSQANQNPSKLSASAADSHSDTSGTTSLGGSFAPPSPTPSGAAGSTSGNFDASSGSLPNPFAVSSGFQSVSGAKICTAPHMQVRVSIGTTIDPGVQTALGMMFVSGIEGVYYGH